MTYRTAAIAAALAAAAASTVAPAADRTPAPAGDVSASAKNKSDAPKRYCIRPSTPGGGVVTGSIVPLSGCRTRAQWESLGVSLPKD